jgi:DNA-binding transcriptional ArsR family regulator
MMDAAPLTRYQLAEIGSLLAEPARAAILLALADGSSRPAGELARLAGIGAATASAHLHRLLEGELLALQVQGRHRYYRLADERIAAMLESLALARLPPPTLPSTADAALCRARTCYRHLAGALGVAFCGELLRRDWLHTATQGLQLRSQGVEALVAAGLDASPLPQLYGRSCVDWTERRMHLGGPLGVALTASMLQAGWLRPQPRSRVLQPSIEGLRQLAKLGVRLD